MSGPSPLIYREIAMRLATWLLGLPLAASILVALTRATVHFSAGWPTHAQHHLVHQIAIALGIAWVSFLVLLGPLQRREQWAWRALAVAGAFIYGGYWLGNLTVGHEGAATVPNASQAIQTVLYAAGLVLSRRQLSSEQHQE